MNNQLDKFRNDDARSPERRRMNEALARLESREISTQQGQVARYTSPAAQGAVGRKRAGRLVVALDLTSSRSESLKQARIATAAMFDAIKAFGEIAVKLVYYRGWSQCKSTAWQHDPDVVRRAMQELSCSAGQTQIARALRHILENETEPLSGVVFIGDHCEDDADEVIGVAGAFGKKKTPLFVFHECADHDRRSLKAKPVFERMAEASGGFYTEFRPDAADVLRELLSSVAAFSTAGVEGVKQVPLPRTQEGQRLQKRLLFLGPGGASGKR
jgi:hypothetical protein